MTKSKPVTIKRKVMPKQTGRRDASQNSWEARRNKAIRRFVAAWETDDGLDQVDAADALALAHIAAVLEWEGGPAKDWEEKEIKAMKRVVAAWQTYDPTQDDPEAEQRLNEALAAVARAAVAFETSAGTLKW
jgi:hypothetical protein